jgi:hypothetical protein
MFSRASESERFHGEWTDRLIAYALEEAAFHSVRPLASATKYLLTIVWRHLHSAGYVMQTLRLARRTVSDTQQAFRVELINRSKQVILWAKHRDSQFISTCNKSRFSFSPDNRMFHR